MKNIGLLIGIRLLAAGFIALLLAFPAAAAAITLDFENASAPSDYIPNGYGSVNWQNFGGHPDYVGGYHTGIVSGSWTAFNLFGDPAEISRSKRFDLVSGYFTGAWRDDMGLTILGFRNGAQIFSTTTEVDSTGPTLLTFNWHDVDLVRFIAFGGVNAVAGGDGTTFVVDNLTIRPTPIPAALPLFATALGGLAFAARRRRVRAA
jgi:hypothetical protein